MLIVDKMVLKDQIAELEEILAPNLTEVQLLDRTITFFGCSTKDAFSVFEDLYLLANSEKPHFTVVRKCGMLTDHEPVHTNQHQPPLDKKLWEWWRPDQP